MALNDKLKGFMRAAGQEARKLTRVGQLKMDLMSAETALADAHKALGKFVARRLIDKKQPELLAEDPAIAERVAAVESARDKVASIQQELATTRED